MAIGAKAAFESDHFKGATGTAQTQLQRALASGPAHIMPDRLLRPGEKQKVESLKFVQEALNRLQSARAILDLKAVPQSEIDAGSYGPGTEEVVRAFKNKLQVLGPGQTQVDVITGVLTLSNLDEEMCRLEGKLKPDDNPFKAGTVDIVVDILGFGSEGAQGQQTRGGAVAASVTSPEYKSKNRKLVVIQFTGSGDHRNPVPRIRAQIDAATAGNTLGAILMRGESAGGPNVLQLADVLICDGLGAAIRYCGLADGAFFDGQTVSPPPPMIMPIGVPLIRSPAFPGPVEKVNIYQSFGNGRKFSVEKGRMIWFGLMENREVHGDVAGFANDDLSKTGGIRGPDATIAHTVAATRGLGIHENNIRRVLSQLPAVPAS